MRGWKSTLVLLLVLVGLVAYIQYGDPGSSTDDDREQAFGELEADSIQEVAITSASGERSVVRKTDGTWNLVEPVQTRADETEMTSITSSLASLDIQRVVDENATELQQYGLDPARIEVAFKTGDDTERRILLGERTPTGGDIYARLPDTPRVFLVSSFLESTFNKDTFALRDKDVIDVDREKVERVEINAGERSVTLAKSGTEWRIEKPIAARADFAAVEGALERLSSARMQGIVDETGNADLKKYRLDPPVASFTAIAGSARATLLLGETENALIYAKDASRPVIFTVAPTLYTDLVRDLQDFRRKDLFDSRSFTANRIELRRSDTTVVLEKSKTSDGKEGWKTGDGKDVDTSKAEDLLSRVTGLRADSFQTSVPPALKTPELTVSVTFDDKKMEQVSFARAGSEVFASRSDEPGAARLTATSYEDALKALDALNEAPAGGNESQSESAQK